MKVGFSLGRCVRDIVNDIVTYDDVELDTNATIYKLRKIQDELGL